MDAAYPRASVSRIKELSLQMSDDDLARLLDRGGPEALTDEEALRLTYEWELWARPVKPRALDYQI